MKRSSNEPITWTSRALGAEVLLDVPGSRRPRSGLEASLRRALAEGALATGDLLPSSRTVAKDLGVARGTVVAAYEQLRAEGWLESRPGGRTRVARHGSTAQPAPAERRGQELPKFDFRPGAAAWWSFPRADWASSIRRVLREASDAEFGYGGATGVLSLKAALAAHLVRARSVAADPAGLFVCGGFRQGLASLCRVLVRRGARSIGLEDPCLPLHREVCELNGLRVVPLPCDEDGLIIEGLERARVDAVIVTPAHHFPLGVALAPARRAALLDWARTSGALIVEDDYDGEFRYDRQGIGALQALDPERVVYGGTSSKTIAPGLRLGWLMVPSWLRDDLWRERELEERGRPILEQLALADLLQTTRYDQHIRRMRLLYRQRRDHLVSLLVERAPAVRVSGMAAGMQLLLHLPGSAPGEDVVVRAASERGLGVAPLGPCYADGAARAWSKALVVNHAGPPPHLFDSACAELAGFLGALPAM